MKIENVLAIPGPPKFAAKTVTAKSNLTDRLSHVMER